MKNQWLIVPLFVAGLSACSLLGANQTVDVSKLTPRETLASLEISYTAAANAANQMAPSLPAATKVQLRRVYAGAGAALSVADTDVLALPAGSLGTPQTLADITLVQTMLAQLQALIIANGGKL